MSRRSALVIVWSVALGAHAQSSPPRADGVGAVDSSVWVQPPAGPALEFVAVAGDLWIAKHETTWASYRAFCVSQGRAAPGLPAREHWSHPANTLTLDESLAYCRWAGLDLPTPAEWAQAAYGPERRAYPWGDEPRAGSGNFCDRSCPEPWGWREDDRDDGFPYTAPVGSFPAGAAPCGALDMGGNVWEWCRPTPTECVAAGGGWCSPTSTASGLRPFPPDTRWAGLGLRPVLRRDPRK